MENPYNVNSPFTIRLELLKLAQSIENDRIWVQREQLEQNWNAQKETTPGLAYPKMPSVTHEDVIRVAEELNKFVSNKG